MRKFALTLAVLLLCASSPLLSAQKKVEAGLFLDDLSIAQTSTNNVGVGGRLGFRVHRDVMMEGELAYDYGINFQQAYRNVTNGNLAAIENTSIGVTDGLFGPALVRASGRLHPFLTLKGGFMDFRLSPSLIPYGTVTDKALGLRSSSLNPAMYPAGGVEPAWGPLGLRLEMGDAMYFNSGAHNNLRVTVGPILRF
jgi:hypothetical protein